MNTLYERDYHRWAQETAALIRDGRLDRIDRDALAEEIEGLGRTVRKELERRFELYLMHRLKWEYQPERRTRSWTLTMTEQQRQVRILVTENPSLRPMMKDLFANAYPAARTYALSETDLEEALIPETNTFAFEDCFPELMP